MIEKLQKLTIELQRVPSKKDINSCEYLPSYNTLLRKIGKLSDLNLNKYLYDTHPKKCKNCGKAIAYSKRSNNFCNQSCSAIHTNSKKEVSSTKLHNNQCKICENVTKSAKNKYCSKQCESIGVKRNTIDKWLSGEIKGWTGKTRQLSKFVRNYIYEIRGTACEQCGWDEKHPNDGNNLTEIDHIDGNAENCLPDNLRVLCPNCHSMTSTYRTRNKNSKRNRK